MTTDPFNTADTYFDEMPHHLADHCEHAGVRKACRSCRQKFDASAQWARDHLAVEVRKAKAEAWQEGVNFATRTAQPRQETAMNTDEYVPSEGEVRSAYVSRYLTDQLRQGAEFDRFLARVRRDAAREALDGLAEDVRGDWHREHGWIAQPVEEYRDTHYPEDVTP